MWPGRIVDPNLIEGVHAMTTGPATRLLLRCDSRSAVIVGGISVLERQLEEAGRAAHRGLIDARVAIRAPDGEIPRAARTVPGLSLEVVDDGEFTGSGRPAPRWMVVPAGLVLGPGALGQLLAPGGSPVRFVDEGGVVETAPFVAVLDDSHGVGATERALFASLGKESDGVAARYVNRAISTRLSRWLVRARVGANALSVSLLMLLPLAVAVLARGDRFGFVAGTALFNAISVLDGCDGEIARVTYTESRFGARLDTVVDMIGHLAFAVALGIGVSRQPGVIPPWPTVYRVEGLVTAALIALGFLGLALAPRLGEQGHFRDFGSQVVAGSPLSGMARRAGDLVVAILRQDTYRWIFVAMALAGWYAGMLHALTAAVAIHVLALGYLWMRQPGAAMPSDSGAPTMIANSPDASEERN